MSDPKYGSIRKDLSRIAQALTGIDSRVRGANEALLAAVVAAVSP
jgi:hypothetical protein